MIKIYKYGAILILVIAAFTQIICINILKEDNNINVCSTKKYEYTKNMNEIIDEISDIKSKTILSANEADGKWKVKLKINGNEQELLDEISKLKNYNINNYEIIKNEKEEYIILEISAKEINQS